MLGTTLAPAIGSDMLYFYFTSVMGTIWMEEELEPVTLELVAQSLNQLRYRVAPE
jgi:hypothetical protein